MQRQLFHSGVELGHMIAQLPEGIDEKDGVVPGILPRCITGSR